MRLRDYSSFFQPEELEALVAAYEAAWHDLWTKRLSLSADQSVVLRKIWPR